jgi:hypothetical protein
MVDKHFGVMVTGILFIIIGMLIVNWGWNVHQGVIKHYNCLSCSIFDKQCPPGYDTEENRRCQDSEEWPFKFSLLIPMIGIMFIIIPFIELFQEYYNYFKNEKNIQLNKHNL